MANILLVDSNEVARMAMKGLLERGGHRMASVGTSGEALEFIRANIVVDLVILELNLEGGGGLDLIASLQANCFLKLLPVVIYTGEVDRATLHRALAFKAQNFLLKPYRDDLVFAEIAKATANPWRNLHFEEERSFCRQMGFQVDALHEMLKQLRRLLEGAELTLRAAAEAQDTKTVLDGLAELQSEAETAGAWGVAAFVGELQELVQTDSMVGFLERLRSMEFAGRMIFWHLNAKMVPESFLSPEEVDAKAQTVARAFWCDAPARGRCPVVPWTATLTAVDKLTGCPVIDTVAAGFQMVANGHPSSLTPIMDLVERDPGLAAQMLVAGKALKHAVEDEFATVEDPRSAVSLLGEKRLASLAGSLVTIPERQMQLPSPTWSQYWMFQIGMAHMARYVCRFLEMPSLESRAFMAGLLHDLGRLLLFKVHPIGSQVILDYARRERVSLREAERLFIGGTSVDLAVHFAEKHGLPSVFVNAMRWIDDPGAATVDSDLVAIVALSRELCQRNGFGRSGETLPEVFPALEETKAWRVLGPQVFTGFNLAHFEAKVHAGCLVLEQELRGRRQAVMA